MPYPMKETPIRYCEQCGKLLTRKRFGKRLEDLAHFNKRRFCDHVCHGKSEIKDEPTLAAIRKRYVEFRGDKCEHCGTTENLGTHHLDEDPTNNAPSNLMTLCGSCHTKWHWEHGKSVPKRQSVCKICGKPSKAYDLCLKHYQRFKKYGDPLLTMKRNGSRYELARAND